MSLICPVCFECGSPLDKYDAFLYMKDILLVEQAKTETADDKRSIDPELNQKLNPIFVALHIEKYCCRKIYTAARSMHNF